MNAKSYLTSYIREQENWIKSQIGSLPQVTGDTEAAEDTLMEVLADARYDTWETDYSTEEWFIKLVTRKARIDRLEN
jgi:hypothetical protein